MDILWIDSNILFGNIITRLFPILWKSGIRSNVCLLSNDDELQIELNKSVYNKFMDFIYTSTPGIPVKPEQRRLISLSASRKIESDVVYTLTHAHRSISTFDSISGANKSVCSPSEVSIGINMLINPTDHIGLTSQTSGYPLYSMELYNYCKSKGYFVFLYTTVSENSVAYARRWHSLYRQYYDSTADIEVYDFKGTPLLGSDISLCSKLIA